jgi:bifunctional non-homologous end joining protein LigD
MTGVVPSFSPMLASSGLEAAPATAWAFEPKLDGWRVLVYIDGHLMVRTCNGHNVTASVPELEPMAAALEGRSVVLDGELVARQGRPFDFYGLAPRLSARAPASVARRRARMPVTFAACDVLYLDGETVTRLPYVERRSLLEGLKLTGPAWCTVLSVIGDGPELMAACGQLGLEGLVAKRLDSTYRAGARSKDWVKAKCPAWRSDHAPRR